MSFFYENYERVISDKNTIKDYVTFGMITFGNFNNSNYEEIYNELKQILGKNILVLEIIYFEKNKLIFLFKKYNTDDSYCILNNILKDLKKVTNSILISALNIKIYELYDKEKFYKPNIYLNILRILKKNMRLKNELIIVNKI